MYIADTLSRASTDTLADQIFNVSQQRSSNLNQQTAFEERYRL
jgi:hypothetical protein